MAKVDALEFFQDRNHYARANARIAALEAERDGQADQAATYRKRCREYADQLAALEAENAELREKLGEAREWIDMPDKLRAMHTDDEVESLIDEIDRLLNPSDGGGE